MKAEELLKVLGGGMNIRQIVFDWLTQNNYGGLSNPEMECGCALKDFMPCGYPSDDCVAGHVKEASPEGEYDYLVYPGKGPS